MNGIDASGPIPESSCRRWPSRRAIPVSRAKRPSRRRSATHGRWAGSPHYLGPARSGGPAEFVNPGSDLWWWSNRRSHRRAARCSPGPRRPTVDEAAGQVLRFALLTPSGRNGGGFPRDKSGWLG